MKVIISAVVLLFFLSSCNNDSESDIVYTNARNLMDVSYGPDSKQKMDIYLPPNRSNSKTKVFVLIHGGGWTSGDKVDFNSYIPKLQMNLSDFAIVNINYRLVGSSVTYLLPYLTDDVKYVLDNLGQNSSEYGIKPEFVLCGVSAGGHLSMLYSYKYDDQKRVKAVVNIVGPTNFEDSYYTSYPQYWDAIPFIIDPSLLPPNYSAPKFASPITWVTNSSAPTISFFGSNDELVPPSQKTILDQKLQEKNVANESYLYNGGHGIGGDYENEIISKTKSFIYKYVK
ncbi:alpha/beta hydrolase [Kaistella jeonii]|nr:alpha/beta hydrolase [Kaistella jeonii]SFB84583.1 Acetyl esterase/lipase [Kaistella jeonii]VEI96105.1 acetyl esterase [Kaistella jeonii]